MNKEIKNKLIQIIVATVLLAIAYIIQKTLNLPMWINLIIYLIPYLIVGHSIIKEACENILHGEFLDEDFLMTIATAGALIIGFLPNSEAQFVEAVFVMIFYNVGELFEEIAEGKSEKAITELMKLKPEYANIEKNGKTIKVKPDEINIDDIIVIKPGEKVPVDGTIIEGNTSLNTVAITGESVPRQVELDEVVKSGCINLTNVIKIRATNTYSNSTVSKIIEMVETASENKSKSEKFITKFAKYYTPTVVIIAILISIIPLFVEGVSTDVFTKWFARALTFLVVSCPCALVISVPLAFFGGIGGASKNGILIKGANYLEALANTKTIIFDKTGTLTEGVFEVTAIHPEIYDENKLLHLAAHVERYSTHPIAVSLKEAYENEDDDCKVSEIEEFAGNGIKAKVNSDIVYVGNSKLMDEIGIKWKKCRHTGTTVHVAINDEYFGHIIISDKIKPDSEDAINEFKRRKIKTIMLSGDHEDVAKSVADILKLDEYYAELLPEDKVKKLKEEINKRSEKTKVVFVGDGINDAPVLANADIGIAMGGIGSDVSIEAADIVLMEDKVSKIHKAIDISKKTMKIAKENIVFAIAVKIIVLALASIGYAPMWLAIFADVGVTIIAVLNSMRTLTTR